MTSDSRNRWIALVLLCMGSLMIVLDTTIVNVALPSIRGSLGFSQTSLAWVVNAYMLTLALLGFGAGAAFNPLLLAAMGDVDQSEAGLASGIVNTSFMMGGALGLAVLASVAASRTSHLIAAGNPHLAALVGGYRVAFIIGTAFAVLAAGLSAQRLRPEEAVAGAPASEPALADASV